MIWLAISTLAIIVISYLQYRADRITDNTPPAGESIAQEISSNFSFGFNKADLSKVITLQDDEAMSIEWQMLSDRSLQATFKLGPFIAKDINSTAQIVAMVPASAKLLDCSYVDLKEAMNSGVNRIVAAKKIPCSGSTVAYAQYFSTPLVPTRNPDNLIFINMSFEWRGLPVKSMGFGRKRFHLRYQGHFSLNPTGFVPADQVKLRYDTSNSGKRSGLPHGVLLRYKSKASISITDVTPEPNAIGENLRTWVVDKNHPTYYISILTEEPNARQIFQMSMQGIFLIVGAIIGAAVPTIRRRKSKGS